MAEYDLIVVGAGPAGQSLVAQLAGARLRIALIDKEYESALAAPAYDGREIALTHKSVERLRRLGAWSNLAPDEISPIARAEVLDGGSPHVLAFADRLTHGPLGWLVPNSAIRRSLYAVVSSQANCDAYFGVAATVESIDKSGASVRLADGRELRGRLVVAADTRFSGLRKSQGIAAHMFDFGRTMLVCRVGHTRPHDSVATEWFDHGQTIAMLPLNGNVSSLVLTLDSGAANALATLDETAFAREIERRTQRRWGGMTLASTRHCYPLVATYASRFVARRFALIGDAAVGMHPVTAHGFNFGLRSAVALADRILHAQRRGLDIAEDAGLRRYERGHRLATMPLFAATNAIARLYGDERRVARVLRGAGVRAMTWTPGARRMVESSLRH
ncbi:MAG: 5-demethoxyubiquinol-8 5-hydroxylase UbiM [Hyphomonadaceae bacterium]